MVNYQTQALTKHTFISNYEFEELKFNSKAVSLRLEGDVFYP